LSFLGQTKKLGEICFSSLHSTKFLEFFGIWFFSPARIILLSL
jgi:hypothetical protein